MRTKLSPALALFCCFAVTFARAESQTQSNAEFAKYAMKLRENALLKLEPQVVIPTSGNASSVSSANSAYGNSSYSSSYNTSSVRGRYPWKTNIVTTIFWVGEGSSTNNPTPNRASSWDPDWMRNYGGLDDPNPTARRGFFPARFVPQQNPFYCALPYNDVTHGATKPEAPRVIPWFRDSFHKFGQSVCHDRWLAIRNPHNGRVAYAQWSDCGPFRTDHWQYVFGNETPKPNLNGGAGLDVSPSVRDYLGINMTRDVTDWKFVEFSDVPPGPWSKYGENNAFVLNSRRGGESMASRVISNTRGPAVIIK